jgi:hypothetical protein
MQRIKTMTSNPSAEILEQSIETEIDKLFLGTVIFVPCQVFHVNNELHPNGIKIIDTTQKFLFQTVLIAADEESAKATMPLLAREQTGYSYEEYSLDFISLYEVTSDSPEYFTLTKYFK